MACGAVYIISEELLIYKGSFLHFFFFFFFYVIKDFHISESYNFYLHFAGNMKPVQISRYDEND